MCLATKIYVYRRYRIECLESFFENELLNIKFVGSTEWCIYYLVLVYLKMGCMCIFYVVRRA